MIHHANGRPDHRYTVTREYIGRDHRAYVARFCGAWIGWAETEPQAWRLAAQHNATRTE